MNVLNFLASLIQTVLVMALYFYFIGQRPSVKKWLPFCLVITIVAYVTALMGLPLNFLILFLGGLLAGKLLTGSNFKFIQDALFVIVSIISVSLVAALSNELIQRVAVSILGLDLLKYLNIYYLLAELITWLLVWSLQKSNFAQWLRKGIAGRYLILFMIFFLMTSGILLFNLFSADGYTFFQGDRGYIVLLIILLAISALVWYVGFELRDLQLERKLQEKEYEALETYTKQLEVMSDEIQSFKHDYLNMFLSLKDSVEKKDIDSVQEIFERVIAPATNTLTSKTNETVKLNRIKIPELKSMMRVKVIEMQQQNITLKLEIPDVIAAIEMDILQFITVMSILLDNALEEAKESDLKEVRIALFAHDDYQRLVVINSCEQRHINLKKIFDKKFSTKNSSDTRGYGLYTLNKIISSSGRYSLETEFDFPYFTQSVQMKIADSED